MAEIVMDRNCGGTKLLLAEMSYSRWSTQALLQTMHLGPTNSITVTYLFYRSDKKEYKKILMQNINGAANQMFPGLAYYSGLYRIFESGNTISPIYRKSPVTYFDL